MSNYTFRERAARPRPNGLLTASGPGCATFHYRSPRARRFDLWCARAGAETPSSAHWTAIYICPDLCL